MRALVSFLLTAVGIFCMLCVTFTVYVITVFVIPDIDVSIRIAIALLTTAGVSAIACILLWIEEKYTNV